MEGNQCNGKILRRAGRMFMDTQTWRINSSYDGSALLLEDNVDLASSLKEFLELYSWKTVHVTNGVNGLRKLMVMDFDVILCDMVMPAFPGDMFYRAVERVKPSLCSRFIFMTGHKADPKWDLFIREIGGLILWKPFHMHELVGAVQSVMGTPLQLRPGLGDSSRATSTLTGKRIV